MCLVALVVHGTTMHCLFEKLHSHGNGPRDLRVALDSDGDHVPGFYCFHNSCQDAWAPLNKELRRRIWFAEHGVDPERDSVWEKGVARPPKIELTKARFDYSKLAARERKDWRVDERWFMERSPVPLAGVGPVEFVNHVFPKGSKVLVFTKFQSQGQFMIWAGRGCYRLSDRRDVRAVPQCATEGWSRRGVVSVQSGGREVVSEPARAAAA